MKKVGIVTINDYDNYGNRLQNYAVQEVIKALKLEAETIIYDRNSRTKDNNITFAYRLKKFLSQPISSKFDKLSYYFINKINVKQSNHRKKLFKEFSKRYINESEFVISMVDIQDTYLEKYDFFITGSDQVWNYVFGFGTPIDFLTFVPKDKRIAYAPSFGVSFIADEFIKDYTIWLNDIKSISVREQAGAKIIKDLTGREAAVLVDPTLMLSKEKWLTISKEALSKPKKKYILTYFLGKENKIRSNYIKKLAKSNNMEVVNLGDIKKKNYYMTDPSEFLDYINSADLLCTDSFHGVIFSIIMKTPFIVFDRITNSPSMNSRIETLLKIFHLEARIMNGIEFDGDVFDIDYSHVGCILEIEQKKALEYLKEALNL